MINVVDIFAGPGGLGEGFAALRTGGRAGKPAFSLRVSAEMEAAAHRTLTLRAYFRMFGDPQSVPDCYRAFIGSGGKGLPYDDHTRHLWDEASREALQLTLGNPDDNATLDTAIIERVLKRNDPWILIGGPPCQAYSLIGRSRNKGKKGYVPEDDHRHFLYREYLRLLKRHQPDAFVMENVKGILSSNVTGQRIFERILDDLSAPTKAHGRGRGAAYDIYALGHYESDPLDESDPYRFLIRSERHGVPQARHRVILLGVRRGSGLRPPRTLINQPGAVTVGTALAGLPALRSGISNRKEDHRWHAIVCRARDRLAARLDGHQDFGATAELLGALEIPAGLERASPNADYSAVARTAQKQMPDGLARWLVDPTLQTVLNHDTRGHMAADIERYLFMSAHSKTKTGAQVTSDNMPGFLAPAHKSWKKGGFKDRFKVQVYGKPAGTVTSHISKDGHHFIHPDPAQCRSLTVREAARLQTFPDNYFFTGARTAQYHQVGNAVPPFLARQIAEIVAQMFST
jgi:DNA (cytosine-5)-methyltransferase 1